MRYPLKPPLGRPLYTESFPVGGSNTPADQVWQRIEVEYPALIYPIRNDGLMGSPGSPFYGGIVITYSPREPARGSSLGIPSGHLGACYLWEKGEWWIKIQAETDTGGWPTPDQRLEFAVIANPPESLLEGRLFGRLHHGVAIFSEIALGGGRDTVILSAQELLDGVTGIELELYAASGVFAGLEPGYYWGVNNSPILINQSDTPSTEVFRFELPFLPLADLHIITINSQDVRLGLYY